MTGPIVFVTIFVLMWLGSLLGGEEKAPPKTQEEELAEAIAQLLMKLKQQKDRP